PQLIEALAGALAALEPKPLGRKPNIATPAEQEAEQLRARVADLEAQLRVAAVRTEVAAILPHTAAAAKKKRRSFADGSGAVRGSLDCRSIASCRAADASDTQRQNGTTLRTTTTSG